MTRWGDVTGGCQAVRVGYHIELPLNTYEVVNTRALDLGPYALAILLVLADEYGE